MQDGENIIGLKTQELDVEVPRNGGPQCEREEESGLLFIILDRPLPQKVRHSRIRLQDLCLHYPFRPQARCRY